MRHTLLFVLFVWLGLASSGAQAATFTVNLTTDLSDTNLADGVCDTNADIAGLQCTLRAAILQANNTTAMDTINFNIPGTGVKTISPPSALPTITRPVVIDGYSQPGSSANTLATGNNAVLLIELRRSTTDSSGLHISGGSGSTIKGLLINSYRENGIIIFNSRDNRVEGCFIGTDATGTIDMGGIYGVRADLAVNNVIGGTAPAARNLISGNIYGVVFYDSASTGNVVQGNYIGTNAAGTASLGNGGGGILAQGRPIT